MSGIEEMEWHNNPFSKMEDASNPARNNPDAADGREVSPLPGKSPEDIARQEREERARFETSSIQQQKIRFEEQSGDVGKKTIPTDGDINLAFNDFPPKTKTGESVGAQVQKVEGENLGTQVA